MPQIPEAPTPAPRKLRFRHGRSHTWNELSLEDRTSKEAEKLSQLLSSALTTRNLLVITGSGASRAVGGPSMTDLWNACKAVPKHDEVVESVNHPRDPKRTDDIEHLLSLCLFYTKLHGEQSEAGKVVKTYQSLAEIEISKLCRDFIGVGEKLGPYVELLQKLVPRRSDLPRTKFFTTNYDLCLEKAAEILGMPYVDGFSFGFPRHFHGRWLDYDFVRRGKDKAGAEFLDGVFQMLKLHGSIDWEHSEGSNLVVRKPETKAPHLVYPRDEKFALSYEQPFLEMIELVPGNRARG